MLRVTLHRHVFFLKEQSKCSTKKEKYLTNPEKSRKWGINNRTSRKQQPNVQYKHKYTNNYYKFKLSKYSSEKLDYKIR